MDEIERLKKLARVGEVSAGNSMGENLSYTGTAKADYERKHNIKRGSDEWFKLWFARPNQTVKTQCQKINTVCEYRIIT